MTKLRKLMQNEAAKTLKIQEKCSFWGKNLHFAVDKAKAGLYNKHNRWAMTCKNDHAITHK